MANTGNHIAKTLQLEIIVQDAVVNTSTYDLLEAFSTYPAIAQDHYVKTQQSITTYTEVDSVIEQDLTACPPPVPPGNTYRFTWTNRVCQVEGATSIVSTNKTDGSFNSAAIGQDNRLYFGGSNIGIWYLDNDGLIKVTNKTDGYFDGAALGQDGKLYFCGYVEAGLWYLDNDEQIKQMDSRDGYFYDAAMAQNGKLYFCGNYNGGGYTGDGISYLDDGTIKQTNKTNGSFFRVVKGQNGKLYFGEANTGIWYLDNDGTIKQTNKTAEPFNGGAIGQNNKLYFMCSDGIWYLDDDAGYAQTLLLEDKQVPINSFNVLDAFDTYNTITKEEYLALSISDATKRAQAFLRYQAKAENVYSYYVSNVSVREPWISTEK